MFQIECALNPTANTDAAETPAASLLKKCVEHLPSHRLRPLIAYACHRTSRTFYGKMRQQLVFEDSSVEEPVRTKEELFSSLLVDVAEEGRNVYDGLDTVFDNSLVDIEGKQARREVSLVEIPSLLQIQLQRVQYDREQQKAYKSNAHMSFGDTISMDRYLAVDPNDTEGLLRKDRAAERKVALDKCRARLDELTKPKVTDSTPLRTDYTLTLDALIAGYELGRAPRRHVSTSVWASRGPSRCALVRARRGHTRRSCRRQQRDRRAQS